MYKYDLHVHTAEVSTCGKVKAEQVVTSYKEAGYKGIVITDHYYASFFESLSDVTWEEKIDTFLSGYRRAYQEGKKLGLEVFPGLELRFTENNNDYLVFGLDEKFLKTHENFIKIGLKKFKELTAGTDCLIYQAHPFREGMIPVLPELLDGVEVYNGNRRHNSRNDRAYLFAAKNKLKMISGSDFHKPEDLGWGGVVSPEKILSIEELITYLKEVNTCENLIIEAEVMTDESTGRSYYSSRRGCI